MARPTLQDRVIEHIRRQGPVTARTFMEWALYDPQEGYYMKEHQVFGRGGDFYTAPQVHAVYGSTLARWLVEKARRLGWPELHVVEFGAGTGQLAEQILTSLAHGPITLRYSIVEVSPVWRLRQAERLAEWGPFVSWPENMPCLERAVVIAHELLDALPVHVLRRTRDGLEEAWVDVDEEGRLVCRWSSPSPEGWLAYEQRRPAVGVGYGFEVSPEAVKWVDMVLGRIGAGIVLIVDYGDEEEHLYGAHRPRGTIRAFRRHMCVEEWWEEPGRQDITADVNFTAVGEAAARGGGTVRSFATLAEFLWRAGVAGELSGGAGHNPFDPQARKNRAVKHLLLPGGLGTAFRVMEIEKGVEDGC